MTNDNDQDLHTARSLLRLLLAHRRAGSTTAAAQAAIVTGGVLVCATEAHANTVRREYGQKVSTRSLLQIAATGGTQLLLFDGRHHRRPLLVDNHAVATVLSQLIQEIDDLKESRASLAAACQQFERWHKQAQTKVNELLFENLRLKAQNQILRAKLKRTAPRLARKHRKADKE